MEKLLLILLLIAPSTGFANEADKYRESAEFLKDTTCYSNYMIAEVDKALKGKPVREGYDSLLLMSKAQLYVEKAKTKRSVKYNASLYKRKAGKELNLKTCLPYKKLVAKGKRLEIYELFYMELANSFR